MSTKIYDGFRLADGTDVFAFADAAREALNPVRDRLDARELASRATVLIDRTRFGLRVEDSGEEPNPLRSPLWLAFHAFEAEQRKMDPAVRGHDPHRFEFCLGRDKVTGLVVGIPYFDDPAYRAPFEGLPGHAPFGYWNNTDPPEDVTDADWEVRRHVWDRVVGLDAPAARMLSFTLQPEPTFGMWRMLMPGENSATAAIVEQLPDPDSRAAGMLCRRTLKAMSPESGEDVVRFVVRYVRAAEQVARRHIVDVADLFAPITAEVLTSPLPTSADGAAERLAALDKVAASLVDEVKESVQ